MSILLIGLGSVAVGIFGYSWLIANGCALLIPEGLLSLSITCPFL